jgi:hypothetical protein
MGALPKTDPRLAADHTHGRVAQLRLYQGRRMKKLTLATRAILGSLTLLAAPRTASAAQVVEYTIQDGWGSKSWNTPDTMFRLHVGDTWRIKNLDTTAQHTLHTPGQPCPHGGTNVYDSTGAVVHTGENFDSIPVGGWLDCVLTTTLDNSNGDDQVYDHFQYDGTNGKIYVVVTEP